MRTITTFCSSHLQLLTARILTLTLFLLTLSFTAAIGMTDIYELSERSGSATNMSGSTQIYGPNASYTSSTSTYPIGFTFYFDKVPYTTFSPNASGLMSLGRATYLYPYSHYWPNVSTLSSYYPLITASWSYYAGPTSSGKVHYKVTGTAPHRVLTVEWLNIHTVNSTSYTGGTWQVRLYEGSNTIEFWYGQFNYASTYYFTVGIASSATRYINIWGNNVTEHYLYPSGSYYTYRYPSTYPINTNTVFEFAPCDKNLRGLGGNIAEGGTAKMESGEDELLVNKQVQRGNTVGYQPFAFEMPPSPCEPWTYNITFSGPGAADYSVSPANGTLITNGLAPTINFTPRGVGERTATMTIRISSGEQFTYTLKAEGLSRMGITGDVPEGGTKSMADGSKLLANIDVYRNESRDLRPFWIRNTNLSPTNKGLSNATVQFTLDDPNGQYAMRLENSSTSEKEGSIQGITNATVVLTPGASVTPVITFAPNPQGTARGSGPQVATLTVNADGEEYTYPVCAYSVAPVVEFYFNDESLLSSSKRLFVNSIGCVGETVSGGEFVIDNFGKMPVVIHSVDALLTENEVRQGAPPYPQMLKNGAVVPILDYFISENPAAAPYKQNTIVEFPLTILPGERKVYSLAFIPNRPEKRFGRMFIRSNAINFNGDDVDAYMPGAPAKKAGDKEGILVLDLFGRGIGSQLAGSEDGGLKDLPVLFNEVRVQETTVAETWLHNTGECDMRISAGDVRLVAGDVDEFKLLETLPNTTIDGNGDFVIPPGGSDKIVAQFTPSRSGSRRASVLLKTNDSTLVIEGVSDRGVFYLDLYGVGKAYLQARSILLPPTVIDGASTTGQVTAFNASTEPVVITAADLTGPSIAEITSDLSAWPALPLTLLPGEAAQFGVAFMPLSGSTSGPRTATLEFTLKTGDVITAQIKGVAGTRMVDANPSTLFQAVSAPVGALVREYAVVTNTGTFPVRLNSVDIVGEAKDMYALHLAGRMTLAPGESLFMEVAFQPTGSGLASAQIEIQSNATNGTQYIDLGGTATGISLGDGVGAGLTQLTESYQTMARTAVSGALEIAPVLPNPARDQIAVSYSLPAEGNVEILLYDYAGNMVQQLHSGYETAGIQKVEADVSELATGTYLVVLKNGSSVARKTMMILR